MNLEHSLYAFVILLIAYFIRGIAGFGSGLIAVPLLALFMPLTLVVPLILLLDFSASLVLGGVDFKRVQWREIVWLLPFTILGVVVGTQLLVNLPTKPTLTILALFILIFAIRNLLNIHNEKPISRGWSAPAGFAGGMIGALFGTGGPPYVIYLNHRIQDKTLLRGTFSALFFIEGAIRIVSFFIAGLLVSKLLMWNLLAGFPIMLLALYLGSLIHTGLSQSQLTRLIGAILLVASVSLFVKVLTL